MIKWNAFSLFRLNRFEFGRQHVTQFVVFEHKRLFSIIIFYFHKSNYSQDRFHTHAFNALSFKLFGEYTEYVLDKESTNEYHTERRNSIFKYFPKDRYHKIGNSNGCCTLLLSGPWHKDWKEKINDSVINYTWNRNIKE